MLSGKNGLKATCPVRGQQLFLETADREDLAAQGDLAGHGDVATDFDLGEGRGERRGESNAGGGTVFGDSAFGDVDMEVDVAVEVVR